MFSFLEPGGGVEGKVEPLLFLESGGGGMSLKRFGSWSRLFLRFKVFYHSNVNFIY